MPITNINRGNIDRIGAAFEKRLEALAAKNGLKVRFAGGRYSSANATLKMEIEVLDTGSGMSGQEKQFREMARLYGLEPDHYGKTFVFRGTAYKVTGLNIGSPKYSVEIERVSDGKRMKGTPDMIRNGLAKLAA